MSTMGFPTVPQPTLTVAEVARASDVASSAVRFYDNHGLVPSTRTCGNQRRFYEVDACLIKVIRVAQRVGLSVAEIRELLSQLPDHRDLSVEHFEWLRDCLERETRARIQALRDVFDDLASNDNLCELPAR